MTRALIIGYGSIGKRHACLLNGIGCKVAVLSQQNVDGFIRFTDLHSALKDYAPEYVVVANETVRHLPTVHALVEAGFCGRLLVEKPLSDQPGAWPVAGFEKAGVAYNLRFHPILTALRSRLADDPAVMVSLRCGQHLSEWRPGRDFRQSYSASAASGGGVLRDLSHELDYLLWLMGPWARITALGGNLGVLNIEADEAWSLLLEMESGIAATVSLSYLDRPARRDVIVTTRNATLHADMIAGTLSVNGLSEHYPTARDDTYQAMHHAMLSDDVATICSIEEGQAVMQLINATERAVQTRNWVRS